VWPLRRTWLSRPRRLRLSPKPEPPTTLPSRQNCCIKKWLRRSPEWLWVLKPSRNSCSLHSWRPGTFFSKASRVLPRRRSPKSSRNCSAATINESNSLPISFLQTLPAPRYSTATPTTSSSGKGLSSRRSCWRMKSTVRQPKPRLLFWKPCRNIR